MIDHRYRTIFIHQRKCAGSSIIAAFGHKPGSLEWNAYNDGVLSLGWDRRDRSYLVFSVVRNSFDRLVSAWKYLRSTRERTLLDVLTNPPLEGHDFRHLTRPQVAILKDTQTGALVVDALLRFERLQEDFDRVRERIGAPQCRLAQLNPSARAPDYRAYFDGKTRRLAEERFAEDLETFGYAF